MSGSRLRGLAQAGAAAGAADPDERCELCGRRIAPDHRHLLDLSRRELVCACRPCALLFDREAASNGRLRLVPERRLALPGFALDDVTWEELRIPVDMAFFFRSAQEGRVMAFYPSPMGPTESLLPLEAWERLEAANPALAGMAPDVEALLVNRARGARGHWLVPIADCYALVGAIRTHWRGLTGGREVWEKIAEFYEELDRRAQPAAQEVTT